MSTRSGIRPYLVITNGNMSGNLISTPTVLQSLTMISYSISWIGTSPVGAISVQISNDYSINPAGFVNNPGTWNTMTLDLMGNPVTSIPVSGNSGQDFIDILQTGGYALRLLYTATGGIGTLNVLFNGKVS